MDESSATSPTPLDGLSLKALGMLVVLHQMGRRARTATLVEISMYCRDGVDAVTTALNELEAANYVTRHRGRDTRGVKRSGVSVHRSAVGRGLGAAVVGPRGGGR